MTNGTANESYTFDDVGNRTASHRSASYAYQSGQFNRVASTATANYSYDANGNLVSKSEGGKRWQYVWDYENRLTMVWDRKNRVRYLYDALGRRVQRYIVGGKENTKFIYDGQDVLVDDNNGTLTKYQNGLGIDNKLKVSINGTAKYFLADHLGSTNALTDSSGAITESASYDSFGNATGNLNTRYQFTGREFDNFTGLHYYRARWYDGNLGRFISEDPIGFRGGDVNLYGYVRNKPIKSVDPLGLYEPESDEDQRDIRRDGLIRGNPSSDESLSCKYKDINPWLGIEPGANAHLFHVGIGVSGGVQVNLFTGEICFFVKLSPRLGLGAFAGAGIKVNVGLDQRDLPNKSTQAELALDAAWGGGGKGKLKVGKTKVDHGWTLSGSEIGVGLIGPGAGLAVGVDFSVKKLWCINRPSPCECYK